MTGQNSENLDVAESTSGFSLKVRLFFSLLALGTLYWLVDRQLAGRLFLFEDGAPRWTDFVTFWGAGKQVLAGNAELIYDKAAHAQFLWSHFDRPIGTVMDYMYPPTSLLFV